MNDPTRKCRRRFSSWRNGKRLERENLHYARLFASRGLTIPDEHSIRLAMKDGFPDLLPGARGDLHIVAVYHHYNWEDTSLKPALEKFGTVRVYDWAAEFDHQKEGWHEGRKKKMNEALLRHLEKWHGEKPCDLIFIIFRENWFSRKPSRYATVRGPDDQPRLERQGVIRRQDWGGQAMGSRDICRYFDLCWTSTQDALVKYCIEGARPFYLPEGANPELHRPYATEMTIPVSFVGQCYGNRPDIIKRLKQRGVEVEAYGYGWPQGALSTEEMIRTYSKSRINLGFGGVEGHGDTYCLKGRDFEIPMSGGLYLTERHPELASFFEADKEIVTYSGFEELVEKIHYLLSNPDEARQIRRRGFERARREHSWEKRFEKIFRVLGLLA